MVKKSFESGLLTDFSVDYYCINVSFIFVKHIDDSALLSLCLRLRIRAQCAGVVCAFLANTHMCFVLSFVIRKDVLLLL